jgi:hypothetical protein
MIETNNMRAEREPTFHAGSASLETSHAAGEDQMRKGQGDRGDTI